MKFGSSWWLYMLWLVPVLAILFRLGIRRRRADLARFADEHLLDTIAPGDSDRPRYHSAIALTSVVALILFSLAQPKWGYHWEKVNRKGVDLVIALDTSKSMLADDLAPTRLDRAKLAIQGLLDTLPGDRVAIVAFAGSAFVECPLTLDYGFCKTVLNDIDVDTIPYGGTNVGEAIRKSLGAFEDEMQQFKALVIITDGENLEGDPMAAAKEAKEKGVKIFTVGVGSPSGSLIPQMIDGQRRYIKDSNGKPVNSRLDEQMLQKIALTTGGKYVRASGKGDPLVEIYNAGISSMEKRALGTTRIKRYEPRYQWPLALALLILLIEHGSLGSLARWLAGRIKVRHVTVALALCLCWSSIAFAEPVYKRVSEGNRLYENGKYQDAYDRYTDAQVDAPETRELDFNIGNALYKLGKYKEAVAAYTRATGSTRPDVAAGAHFGIGNSNFKLGEQQGSLDLMRSAIDSYRRALEINPDDKDAKFNIEFVQRRIKELINQQKNQKQNQKQDQKQDQKQQQKQGQQQKKQDQKQQQQKQGQGQQQKQDQKEQQQQKQGQKGQQQDQKQQDQQKAAAEKDQHELSKEEAEAALRAFEQEEKQAREESRRNQQAPYRRPVRDW